MSSDTRYSVIPPVVLSTILLKKENWWKMGREYHTNALRHKNKVTYYTEELQQVGLDVKRRNCGID